jgi:hypothetical protein
MIHCFYKIFIAAINLHLSPHKPWLHARSLLPQGPLPFRQRRADVPPQPALLHTQRIDCSIALNDLASPRSVFNFNTPGSDFNTFGPGFDNDVFSLPYLAFVEALRSYVLSREAKDLREELGSGAADIARIISEIRERLEQRKLVTPAGAITEKETCLPLSKIGTREFLETLLHVITYRKGFGDILAEGLVRTKYNFLYSSSPFSSCYKYQFKPF